MDKKQILICGLCLSGNRGGPAMALAFTEKLKRYVHADFTFSVSPMFIDLEKHWAKQYGFKVIPRETIVESLLRLPAVQFLRRLKRWTQGRRGSPDSVNSAQYSVHKEFHQAFATMDCVINLNGIAFVGDGTRSWLSSLAERSYSIYAKKHKKPFFRFVQSYGPLKDWRVRLLAKREFKSLPCIMARGDQASSYCKNVTKRIPVYTFPDVAITLPSMNNSWVREYLNQYSLELGKYVVLSPSAVMSNMNTQGKSSVGSKHIVAYSIIAKYFISKGQPILFVPHATSTLLNKCDREASRRIVECLSNEGIDVSKCHVVGEELDCRELKGLISGAQLAFVSRYHALVAALSSGTRVVAIGWNEKYRDLLCFYNIPQFWVDARNSDPFLLTEAALEKAQKWTDEIIDHVKKRQVELEGDVETAIKICADWIDDVVS